LEVVKINILIIPSITMKSGTGIRLQGLATSLGKYHTVAIGKMKGPDIVIASKSLPQSCIPALLKRKCVKILDFDDLEYSYHSGTWKEPILKWCDHFFPKRFDFITTHTEGLRQYLINDVGIERKKIIMLPQGVDYDMLQKTDHKTQKLIKNNYKLNGKKVLMWAGHRGVASTGLSMVVIMSSLVNAYQPINVRLFVVGSGIFYNSPISAHTPEVPHEEMPDYFRCADVLVNYYDDTPANHMRSSIKIREALACGLPVITNLVGEIKDIFQPYVYELKKGDPEGFDKAVLKALESPDARTARGREFVRKNYDWKVVAAKFNKDLKRIVNGEV